MQLPHIAPSSDSLNRLQSRGLCTDGLKNQNGCLGRSLQKKDTSVTFWAERFFFCHTYDTSMTIIVTKPGIIIDVVGSYFYDKKS